MTNIPQEKEYSRQFDLELWKKIFKSMQVYKRHMLTIAVCMVVLGIIDAAWPLFTRYAIDNFITKNTVVGLYWFAGVFLAFITVQSIFVNVFIDATGKVQTLIAYDIRKKAFKHLQDLSLSYYDKTPLGWIMSRLTSDARRLSDVIAWGLVDIVWSATIMLGIMGILFYMSWKLALITLAIVPLLVLVSVFFQKRILKNQRAVRKINSKITGAFNEGITGAITSKTLCIEADNLAEFSVLTHDMRVSSVRSATLSAIYLPIVLALGSIVSAAVLWAGGVAVTSQVITYGTLVAFITYCIEFFHPIQNIARIFSELQAAQASAERIYSLLDTKPDITDTAEIIALYGSYDCESSLPEEKIKGDIEFKNVTFAYAKGEKVFDKFNLQVKSGQTIAIVGETGSGKTTLVNLACRFYEPQSGVIKIDGIDYKTRTQNWLHKNLGYMLQTPHLFSGSIMDNIRYGRLNATNEEVYTVTKLVKAHEFINELEKKYDTEVGESGSLLSTGQKQLISFARALLADPAIFVLDEATSSVDTETEHRIQEAVHTMLAGRTSFIVAHRLSTIREADRILFLHKGRIIEDGTHTQLIADKGRYYSL